MPFTINLGLDNKQLYNGCDIAEVGGRLALTTPPPRLPILSGVTPRTS